MLLTIITEDLTHSDALTGALKMILCTWFIPVWCG